MLQRDEYNYGGGMGCGLVTLHVYGPVCYLSHSFGNAYIKKLLVGFGGIDMGDTVNLQMSPNLVQSGNGWVYKESLTLVAAKGKIRHIRCRGTLSGVRPFE